MKAHKIIPIEEIDIVRFESQIQKGDGCWRWSGAKNNKGYGVFCHNYTKYLAHRVSWSLRNGQIESGLRACHKCDNPICVNPDHIFLGTQEDNAKDCWAKGRGHKNHCFAGSKNPKAKLNQEKVAEIRKALASGMKRSEVAKLFQVSGSTISGISMFQLWRLPGDPPAKSFPMGSRIGETASSAKLTNESVREIRKMVASGYTRNEIAAKFGVTVSSIGRIKSGERWAHVV